MLLWCSQQTETLSSKDYACSRAAGKPRSGQGPRRNHRPDRPRTARLAGRRPRRYRGRRDLSSRKNRRLASLRRCRRKDESKRARGQRQRAGGLAIHALRGRETRQAPILRRRRAPEKARQLYEFFVEKIRAAGLHCETGRFQEMMKVELVNEGPVTILLDSAKAF